MNNSFLPAVAAVMCSIMISGCGGTSPSDFPGSENSSNTGDRPMDKPISGGSTISGGSFSAPGSSAAIKSFFGVVQPDKFKSVYITLKGDISTPQIVENTDSSNLELHWLYLSESPSDIEKEADKVFPKKNKSEPNSIELIFQQTNMCSGYAVVQFNGNKRYSVRGSCVYFSELDIPRNFNASVFINNKMVHDFRVGLN